MPLKPIIVYWRAMVPNPSKVIIILEELGLPYNGHDTTLDELHSEPFLSTVNPNGKVPAIHDPNTNVNIWESGACVFYLIDYYNTGPYFGQAAWFCMFHPEPVESVKLRYVNEMKRIVGMLDKQLANKDWPVGGRCLYADLSFIGWNVNIEFFMSTRPADEWDIGKFPNFKRWHGSLIARPSATKALAMMKETDVHSG